MKAATIRKEITAVIGFAAEVVNAGLVHGTALVIVSAIIGAATAFGIYQIPNSTAEKSSPPSA